MNKIFESIRLFQIWTYSVSHSRLILRSVNNEDNEINGYNIDIEFWGVSFIELPDLLKGLRVQKVKSGIPEKFDNYINNAGYNVFEIVSGNEKYFIVAAGYCVGKNNWDNSNRILNPYLEYDEILASS